MPALLVERPDWRELGDAVARTGGWLLSAELVQGSSLLDPVPKLLDARAGSVGGGGR
jgi:hypothetical protein